MTDKYKEAISVWKHTIGDITHEIIPEENDNYNFLRIKDEASKANSDEILNKKIGALYYDMVIRTDPALSEEERVSLKTWISVNIPQISEDFMVAFRWATKEKIVEAKKKAVEVPKQ